MPDKQAVVTLYPLFQPDVLPFRSLTFAPDTEFVEIGRASKREAKGLVPAHHNALFESRVMSRNHAQLRACFEKKEVYIRDNGSMHGTWVNCKKIPADKDVPIRSGDVVIFGTEVIRGEDTYPPMRVRCECQWFDVDEGASNPRKAQDNLKTNTFCVPDDDDEVIEIVDEAPMDSASTGSYVPEDADICSDICSDSDSDCHQSAGNSTPMTSPPKKDVSVELVENKSSAPASDLQSHVIRSQQSPIDLDEEKIEHPLVTPRMTPPSVDDAYEGSYAGVADDMGGIDYTPEAELVLSGYSRGNSATGSDLWEESEEQDDSEDDSISHSSLGVDTDAFVSEADAVAGNVPSTSTVYESSVEVAVSKGAELEEESRWAPTQHDAPCSTAVTSDEHVSLQHDAPTLSSWKSTANEDSTVSTPRKFGSLSFPQPIGISSPVSRSGGRSLDHSLACFHHTTSASGAEECQPNIAFQPIDVPFTEPESNDSAISQDYRTSAAPYSNGPFVNSQAHTGLDEFENGNEIHPTVATMNTNQPSQKQRPNGEGIQSREDCGRVDLQTKPHLTSSMASSGAPRDFNTRLSIADIVDTSAWAATCGANPSRKRKASEMESESELDQELGRHFPHVTSVESCDLLDKPSTSGSAESFSQDAQPQVPPVDLDSSPSHLTGFHTIAKTRNPDGAPKAAAPESERPSKRQRLSGAGSFGSHVASALLGAMVGGLGTVALLASLPTDYFA